MQNEPNFKKTKMNVTSAKTSYYGNNRFSERRQNEPNSNPIYAKQTQFKANFIAGKPFWDRSGKLISKLPALICSDRCF